MSLKDKFEKNVKDSKKSGFTKKSTLETFSSDVESKDYVFHNLESKKDFIPDVDYATASNFARFGSAERYYLDSVDRIINTYPYDGSAAEKQAWENSSSYLDKQIFQKEYPRTTGYAIFSPGGWGSLATALVVAPGAGWAEGYGSPSDQEYIEVKSGANVNNIYNTGTYQEENLKFDLGGDVEDLDQGGVTVEFWLKKDISSRMEAISKKEVVFDLWNGESGSLHGRLLVELTQSQRDAQGHPYPAFLVTAMSGTAGVQKAVLGTGSIIGRQAPEYLSSKQIGSLWGTASVGDNNWHHYAIALRNDTGSVDAINMDFYVDGHHHDSIATGSKIQRVLSNPNTAPDGGNIARIGALRTTTIGNSINGPGWGKLSGSIDDFRYWKTYRTHDQVARNYFMHVHGGTNTDTANTKLGVYYKFNEGITGKTETDRVVLDYSGRLSNGTWTGYDNVSHRNIGSAINESSCSAGAREFKDPILYRNHQDVVNYIELKQLSGTIHDQRNNSYLLNNLPGWILDEQSRTSSGSVGELTKLTQIIASYFDKLYQQTEFLSKLKHVDYEKQNEYPAGMLNSMLQSYGMNSADFFIDSDVMQALFKKDEKRVFEKDLHQIKNIIYKNIHNNLTSIYKSKGSEKSIRNVMRCFGIDDEVFRLNIYNKDGVYEIEDHERITTARKRFVDFSTAQTGTIFQATSSTSIIKAFYDGDAAEHNINMSQAYINFSTDDFGNTHTWEAGVFFPDRKERGDPNHIPVSQVSASIFGVTNVGQSGLVPLTAHTGQYDHRLTLYAVKVDDLGNPDADSKKAKFVIKEGTAIADYEPTVYTSSIFDLYEGTHWNFALRWRPRTDWMHFLDRDSGISNSHLASGSNEKPGLNPGGGGALPSHGIDAPPQFLSDPSVGSLSIDRSYAIEFYGVNADAGEIVNEISSTVFFAPAVTGTRGFVRGYIGATRTGHTGSVLAPSDVMIRNFRCYKTYVDNDEVKRHILDPFNYGLQTPYYSNFVYTETARFAEFFPRIDSLVLNWDFEYPEETGEPSALTGSSRFHSSPAEEYKEILDFSSGSLGRVGTSLPGQTNTHNISTEPVYKYYPGRAVGFDSGSSIFKTKYYQMLDLNVPENLHDYDLINVKETNPNVFTKRTRPVNMFFSIEASMYGLISEEMLHMFSTVQQFNNYIGNPANAYRIEYKELKKLREIYFRGVESVPDFDKFVSYYKWLDSSISYMIEDLFPVSAEYSDEIRTIVESHILERNKYQHKYTNMISGAVKERPFKPTPFDFGSFTPPNFGAIGYGMMSFSTSHRASPGSTNRENSSKNSRGTNKYSDIRNTHTDRDGKQRGGITALRIGKDATDPDISSGDAGVDATRQAIRESARKDAGRRTGIDVAFANSIKGGTNSAKNQNIFAWTGLSFGDKIETAFVATSSNQERRDDEVPALSGTQTVQTQHTVVKSNGQVIQTNQNVFNGVFVETKYANVNAATTNSQGESVSVGLNVNHDDGYSTQLNNPYESSLNGSPFVVDKVGGFFHRHNEVGSAASQRREGYVINTSNFSIEREFKTTPVTLWRFPKIKRPLNIQNIKTISGSIGNYSASHEIVKYSGGRRQWNFAAADGRGTPSSSYAETPFLNSGQSASFGTAGLTGRTMDNGNHNKCVIVQRFSAPGDKYTMSEGFLDTYSGEYSVYNTINFRNYVARMQHRTKLAAKTEQFTTGSVHGIHQNGKKVLKSSSLGTVITSTVYDNAFISTPIPGSDSQYLWITSSATVVPLGYESGSLVKSNNSGIKFLTVLEKTGQAPVDFTQLNTRIVESFNITASVLGGTDSSEAYVNTRFGSLSDPLNARLLNRNGPFGWPTWKQIRVSQNPVTRWQRRNNVHSVNSVINSPERFVRDGENILLTSSAITIKYKPIQKHVETKKGVATYLYTHANEKDLTPHPVLDDGTYQKQTMHDVFYDLYSNESKIPQANNPVKNFRSLLYKEKVWPREVNTFLNDTRTRKDYNFGIWRDDRAARDTITKVNSCGIPTASSIFPMDADDGWTFAIAAAQTGNVEYNKYSGTRGELLTHDGTPAYAATRLNYVNNIGAMQTWDVNSTMVARLPSLEMMGNQARNPYADNERVWEKETRLAGHGMSVVPEFSFSKILDNPLIDPSQGIGNSVLQDLVVFTLTGSFDMSFADMTSMTKAMSFNDRYILTDPVKFAPKNYGPTSEIRLTVKALKKFKPLPGFFPAERVLQLSSMLSSSLKGVTNLAGAQRTARTMIQAFTSPGILMNSIKSSVAVDYALVTQSVVSYNSALAQASGTFVGTHHIEYSATSDGGTGLRRLPFEALLEPFPYLYTMGSTGWHDNSAGPEYLTISTASINQTKVEHRTTLYTKAMMNFITEVEYMWLENGGAQILFPPERDWNAFDVDKTYKGRISLMANNFTSCGNIGGFGPSFLHHREVFYPNVPSFVQAARKLSEPTSYSTANDNVELSFVPKTSKPTVHYLLGNSTKTFNDWRTKGADGSANPLTGSARRDLMCLTASLDIDDIILDPGTTYSEDAEKTITDDAQSTDMRWVIRPKWQTPSVNFSNVLRDYQAAGLTTDLLELRKNQTGIWGTWGENSSKNTNNGLFIVLDDVEDGSKSLWDAVGIPKDERRVKIGEIRESYEIKEAVVAIPMRIDPATQNILFFPLHEEHSLYEDIKTAMGDFLFPPRFDFVRNPQFSAVVMHVFEFSTSLSEIDLCNIWQNNNVNIGSNDNFEIKEKTIVDLTTFDDIEFNDQIRWMIFKVKQRALVNRRAITRFGLEIDEDLSSKYSYNWPYDYFSLVELAELEVGLKFGTDTATSKVEPLTKVKIAEGERTKQQEAKAKAQKKKESLKTGKQKTKQKLQQALSLQAESIIKGKK